MNLQEQIDLAIPGATIRIPDGDVSIGNFVINKSLNIIGGLGSKIIAPTFDPAIKIPPGTGPVSLQGLEITCTESLAKMSVLIEFGSGGADQNSLDKVPQGLTIDKCDIHAHKHTDIQRGIAANGANFKITNSKVREIHGIGYDTQAICSWNGPGPFTLLDCFFEGSGENVMFGGAPPVIPGLIHSDIEIRRCTFFKPRSWCIFSQSEFQPLKGQVVTWTTDPKPGPDDDPTELFPPRYVDSRGSCAIHWTVKNLFELKNARRALIDGCLFDGNWKDAQAGRAIVFTPRPSDSGPSALIEDVLFQNSTVKNVGSGILLLGIDDAPQPQDVRLKRVKVLNNLWLIDGPKNGSNGVFATVIKGTEEVTIEHNTAFQTGSLVLTDYLPSTGFTFRNNIGRHNAYGIFGSGTGVGNPAIAQYFPSSIITGNVIAKEVLSADSPSEFESRYPAGNIFPDKLSDVLGADYRALPAWQGKGTDGKDPGVDVDALSAAQSGIGVPTPTPIPEPVPPPEPPGPQPPETVPMIAITSPVEGVTISGRIDVVVSTNVTGITDAYLLADGNVVSGPSIAPGSFSLDTAKFSDGNHSLFVRAWKEGSAIDSKSITVTVRNATALPPPQPPAAPAVRKVAWPLGEAKQNAVVAAQWQERFRFKRHLSGAFAEFEKVV